MRKMMLSLALAIGLAIGGYGVGRATNSSAPEKNSAQQQASSTPPAILFFSSDIFSVTIEQAEAGNKQATLSWQTIGMRPGDYLTITQYQGNTWMPVLNQFSSPLLPSGQLAIFVQHPLNFGPITYRLALVDSLNKIIEEQFLTILYATTYPDGPSAIDFFTARQTTIDANTLYFGGTIRLAWRINNRLPRTNLIFEQIMEDGTAVSVERSRNSVWVGSSGEGEVAPRLPQSAKVFVLRIRLVDLATGATLDQDQVSINVTGILILTPTPIVTPTITPFSPS